LTGYSHLHALTGFVTNSGVRLASLVILGVRSVNYKLWVRQ